MTNSVRPVNSWEQLSIGSPPVLEITVKIGLLTDEGMIQYQVTALDAADERVIAMWSLPGRDAQNWQRDLARTLLEVDELLGQHIDPF